MIIPRKGDIWEFQIPGKRKKRKEIGTIHRTWFQRPDGTYGRRPYINWYRLPKGRYSGIRPKTLLKCGRRISTKVERDAQFAAMIARRKAQLRGETHTTREEPHYDA